MGYTQEAVSFLFLFDDTNAKIEQTAAKQEHKTSKRAVKKRKKKNKILCQLRTKLLDVVQSSTVKVK